MKQPTRFSAETLKFIKRANRQTRPEWLDKNREDYESHLLLPLKHLAHLAQKKLSPIAPSYHFPQKGIGRIKRSSIRAQEYGSLYKDWISYSASTPSQSRFDHNPNIILILQLDDPDGDHILSAGGLYMPSSRQLRLVREAIAKDSSPFKKLFKSKSFAARFKGGFCEDKKSTRPPRGFEPHHKDIEWLKLQAFFVWRSYSMKEFSSPKFFEQVIKDWELILKLNSLLESATSGAFKKLAPKKSNETTLLKNLDDFEVPRREMDF